MNTQPSFYAVQARLEGLTRKWWLYLLLLLPFFLPTYASQGYDPRQSVDLIGQVLSAPLINTYPVLLPLAKLLPVVLIGGLFVAGNRMRRAFNLYAALLYLAVAFFQNAAVTVGYGLVILTGNLALIFIVALAWGWEVLVERNDFRPRPIPAWRWWVAPLALLAFLAPVEAGTLSPSFAPLALLTNSAGLTFCLMTPLLLAVLTLYHPTVNPVTLRITSFVGMLFGAVNLLLWFAMNPAGWWMGVLHIPLMTISVYAFVLSHRKT